MATIERRDVDGADALRCRDDRRVNRSQRKVMVLRDQFSHAEQIWRSDRLNGEAPGREIAEKAHFGPPAESRRKEVCDLSQDQRGNE